MFKVLALCTLLFFGNVLLFPQAVNDERQACRVSNQKLIMTLPSDNILAKAISAGEVGNAIDGPWLDQMESLGIRQATAKVDFSFRPERLELKLVKTTLLTKYYLFDSEYRTKESTAPPTMLRLEKELAIPFFVESTALLQSLRFKENTCGTLYVSILDNVCLPVRTELPDTHQCTE
jgi:hypothetical protein